MEKREWFSRALVVTGTVLVAFPVLAMLATAGARGGAFRIDWMLPAELFPVVVVGAVALLWAAVRLRSRLVLVASGLGGVVVALIASQIGAVVTGLASGVTTPESARTAWAGVVALLSVYGAASAALIVAGALLVSDSFRRAGKHESRPGEGPVTPGQ